LFLANTCPYTKLRNKALLLQNKKGAQGTLEKLCRITSVTSYRFYHCYYHSNHNKINFSPLAYADAY